MNGKNRQVNSRINRRKILQTFGGGGAALTAVPVIGSATGSNSYVGYTYDTLTHASGHEVRGRINEDDLTGTISVAGFDIELSKLEKLNQKNGSIDIRRVGVLDGENYVYETSENKIPLKVNVVKFGQSISGMLSRPCGEFGHLGFYLLDIDGIQEDFNIDIMSIDSKWKDHTLGFNVPEKGLPTDSSPARFIEQKRIEYNTEDLINELANKENDDFVDQESFRIQADEDAGNIHEIRTVSDDLEGNCEESNMEYWMGVSADDATAYDYDEIGFSQSNRWRFWVFFSERPDDVFPDSCDPANFIHPSNYSLHVEPHDENHYNDLYFSHPEPDDGDGESGNDEVGLALDIIGAAGGRLTEIGASIADYVMAGSGSSTEVNYEQGGAIYNFDVDLDGEYDDLPRELSNEAQTTQFSLRVHNELHPDDSPYLVSFHPQYTFHYADSNSCDCFHAMPIAAYKTIGPNIAWSALYESVHVD